MFPYNRVEIQLRVSSWGPSCFELFREGKHVVDVDDSKRHTAYSMGYLSKMVSGYVHADLHRHQRQRNGRYSASWGCLGHREPLEWSSGDGSQAPDSGAARERNSCSEDTAVLQVVTDDTRSPLCQGRPLMSPPWKQEGCSSRQTQRPRVTSVCLQSFVYLVWDLYNTITSKDCGTDERISLCYFLKNEDWEPYSGWD